jgi:hypothetical protein
MLFSHAWAGDAKKDRKAYRHQHRSTISLRVAQNGVRPRLASNMAGSGRGPWYLALTKALNVGLSKGYFSSLGLPLLFEDC